jgi:hypothetical protein
VFYFRPEKFGIQGNQKLKIYEEMCAKLDD